MNSYLRRSPKFTTKAQERPSTLLNSLVEGGTLLNSLVEEATLLNTVMKCDGLSLERILKHTFEQ